MYSAFSLRSPWAAASATSWVTRGRSTVHSWSSSARSFLAPSGVMCGDRFGGGGRSRVDTVRSISGMLRANREAASDYEEMGTAILVVLGFLVGNGLFAGAEIAILSVRKTRLREFIRRRDKRALAIKKLREQPENFLPTVQVCITTFGTIASVYSGATLEPYLEEQLGQIGLGHLSALILVVILVVFFELVIGELVPKSL